MFGESNQDSGRDAELSWESWSIGSSQDDLSGKSMPRRTRDRIFSGESRNMKDKHEGESIDTISSSDGSKSQPWEKVSETTSNSEASESNYSLLDEWKQHE